MSWLADHFEGFEPITVPCAGCGDPVPLATTDPEGLLRSIARGTSRAMCPACFLGEQAEEMLEER
jgi:hypothetical protein